MFDMRVQNSAQPAVSQTVCQRFLSNECSPWGGFGYLSEHRAKSGDTLGCHSPGAALWADSTGSTFSSLRHESSPHNESCPVSISARVEKPRILGSTWSTEGSYLPIPQFILPL